MALSSSDKKNAKTIDLKIVALRLDGTKDKYSLALKSPFRYKLQLPKGSYKIYLEGNGSLKLSAKPSQFKLAVKKAKSGINFSTKISKIASLKKKAK